MSFWGAEVWGNFRPLKRPVAGMMSVASAWAHRGRSGLWVLLCRHHFLRLDKTWSGASRAIGRSRRQQCWMMRGGAVCLLQCPWYRYWSRCRPSRHSCSPGRWVAQCSLPCRRTIGGRSSCGASAKHGQGRSWGKGLKGLKGSREREVAAWDLGASQGRLEGWGKGDRSVSMSMSMSTSMSMSMSMSVSMSVSMMSSRRCRLMRGA